MSSCRGMFPGAIAQSDRAMGMTLLQSFSPVFFAGALPRQREVDGKFGLDNTPSATHKCLEPICDKFNALLTYSQNPSSKTTFPVKPQRRKSRVPRLDSDWLSVKFLLIGFRLFSVLLLQ